MSFFVTHRGVAQDSLELKGRLLIDREIIEGADVTVFDGNAIVCKTTTNGAGNFSVKVPYGKEYVLQFKKSELPVQKIILNALKKGADNKESITLTLSSKHFSKEGPSKGDAIGTYKIKEKGVVFHENKNRGIDSSKISKEKKAVKAKIDSIQQTITDDIKKMPKDEQKKHLLDYENLQKKYDTILMLAKQEADLIVLGAKNEAMLINEANKRLEKKYNKPIINIKSNIHAKISKDLKRFALSESKFLSKQEVKSYHDVIKEYSKKSKLTSRDSLEYLNNIMLFNEEMIKSAWLQLKVDKLSAKNKEDSIALQKREIEIRIAEKKIEEARNKINLQKAEIKYKNTVILFTIIAVLILAVLLFLLYVNFRNKKKSNLILAKKNKEIEQQNKKILDSIRYAQTIQQAILPVQSIVDKHFKWFSVFLPKDIVSGDFYWFHHFDDLNISVFAVVDCTGHGVPGAFMSLIGNRLLVEAVKEKQLTDTVEILEDIDRRIRVALMQDATSNNDGMDVCVCTIEKLNKAERKVCFSGAKRPIFYTDRSSDEIQYIKGTVRGIGGRKRLRPRPKKEFEAHELLLDKGDKIYLTTDGIFDLQSPERKKFARSGFLNLLNDHKDKDVSEQEFEIMKAIEQHCGTEPQIDDITILGIKL